MLLKKANTKKTLEKLSSLSKTKKFLGKEFLTWLWYKAETQKDAVVNDDEQKSSMLAYDFWIDDRMFLQPFDNVGHENILRGGDPSQSQEATASLLNGKVVKELKLGVHIYGLGDFTAVLNSDDLNPRSLVSPEETDQDEDVYSHAAMAIHRIKCIERFCEVLDDLFSKFLRDRSTLAWQQDSLPDLRDWIASRKKSSAPTIH